MPTSSVMGSLAANARDVHRRPDSVEWAARENISRLHTAVDQCLSIAIEASEDVASAMIDHAIVLSERAQDAAECYGIAVLNAIFEVEKT